MAEKQIKFEKGRATIKLEGEKFILPDWFGIPDEDDGAFIDDYKLEFNKQRGRKQVKWIEIEGERYPPPKAKRTSSKPKTDNIPDMKEWIYFIDKNKKKPNEKKFWEGKLKSGSSAPISIGWRCYFEELDNKKVTIEKVNGVITAINHNGKRYTDTYAVSPYNFIPLNSKPISQYKNSEEIPKHDVFTGVSGFIDFSLTALTPLFIRGEREDFIKIMSHIILPGSSLRGLLKNIIEICSFGKFDETRFQDERMYYRSLADIAVDLRNKYKNEITNGVEAGYLTYDKNTKSYSITPANGFDRVNVKGEFKYFTTPAGVEVHSGKMKNKKKNWIVKGKSAEPPLVLDKKLITAYERDKNRDAEFDLLRIARDGNYDNVQLNNGVPVFFKRNGNTITSFGHTGNYRLPYSSYISNHIPSDLQNDTVIDFAEAMFGATSRSGRLYFEDGPGTKDTKQLSPKVLKILGTPSPTTFQHYLEQNPFGKDTPMSNLKHWDSEDADIRGYKAYWHRKTHGENISQQNSWVAEKFELFSEDLEKFLKEIKKKNHPKEFLSKFNNQYEKRKDSNDRTKLIFSGHLDKLDKELQQAILDYFFLPQHLAKEFKKPQNTIAACADENSVFNARIRFENLTTEELGALLFALELPEGCAHKLGMGKPLGLGSVHIHDVKLTLIDRKERYKKVFDDNGKWNTAEKTGDKEEHKKAFAKYICNAIGATYDDSKGADSLWEVDRLKELKTMLTLNHDMTGASVDWLSRTRYMELDEFKKRPVLPKPSEVIQPNTYNKK